MKIYQLQTPEDFCKDKVNGEYNLKEMMQMYAEHVAKKFAAECVNEALGNKMEVSNALWHAIDNKYSSIEWDWEKEFTPCQQCNDPIYAEGKREK